MLKLKTLALIFFLTTSPLSLGQRADSQQKHSKPQLTEEQQQKLNELIEDYNKKRLPREGRGRSAVAVAPFLSSAVVLGLEAAIPAIAAAAAISIITQSQADELEAEVKNLIESLESLDAFDPFDVMSPAQQEALVHAINLLIRIQSRIHLQEECDEVEGQSGGQSHPTCHKAEDCCPDLMDTFNQSNGEVKIEKNKTGQGFEWVVSKTKGGKRVLCCLQFDYTHKDHFEIFTDSGEHKGRKQCGDTDLKDICKQTNAPGNGPQGHRPWGNRSKCKAGNR